jgi:D-alanyl-D-alanine carboxypeptidase
MARIPTVHKTDSRSRIVTLLLFCLSLITVACASAPALDKAGAEEKIARAFAASSAKGSSKEVASLLAHSEKLGLHIAHKANPDGPAAFHIASVGKMFTSVLIGRLIDSGRLTLESRVAPLLPPGILEGLFVFDGTDHQSEITIRQLLAHTSGVADYFSGPVKGGKEIHSVEKLIVSDPHKRWTALELLDFSRNHQEAAGVPGDRYNYSDTGFIILGLVVEAIHGRPFHEVLSSEILTPLGMADTFMPFLSEPASGRGDRIRKAWLGKAEVSTNTSITADWAGGGIASTEEDLLKFSTALWTGVLLSEHILSELRRYDRVFMKGIEYGTGLMRLDFGEFFFLLKGYPKPEGHIGILATMLMYSPEQDLHIVINFGDSKNMESAFKLAIQVFGILLSSDIQQ